MFQIFHTTITLYHTNKRKCGSSLKLTAIMPRGFLLLVLATTKLEIVTDRGKVIGCPVKFTRWLCYLSSVVIGYKRIVDNFLICKSAKQRNLLLLFSFVNYVRLKEKKILLLLSLNYNDIFHILRSNVLLITNAVK